jgi:hypothetical protein
MLNIKEMHDGPSWLEPVLVRHAIDQDATRKVLDGLDEDPTLHQREIGVAAQERLHHPFDFRRGRHRPGLTSVTMMRCVPG